MWKWLVLFSLNIGCTFETYHPVEFEDDMAKEKGKITGWAGSADLRTGKGVNAKFTRFPVQAELEEEGSLTTQFNMIGQNANCRAEIISLANGNAVRRVITVVDGASITTRGKNINVRVGDFTDAALSNNVEYQVAVLSTLGIRAGSRQPPTLAPLVYRQTSGGPLLPIFGSLIVPASTGYIIPVPQDAGIIAVEVEAIGSGDIIDMGLLTVQQNNSLGSSSAIYEARDYSWVPLYPNVVNIQVVNSDTSTEARFSVMFGIDG